METETAEGIISQEVDAIGEDSSRIRENGCAACHVLFTIKDRMGLRETDAAVLLTEAVLASHDLDERFMEMVKNMSIRIM